MSTSPSPVFPSAVFGSATRPSHGPALHSRIALHTWVSNQRYEASPRLRGPAQPASVTSQPSPPPAPHPHHPLLSPSGSSPVFEHTQPAFAPARDALSPGSWTASPHLLQVFAQRAKRHLGKACSGHPFLNCCSWGSWLGPSEEHATLDLGVVSSSPTLGVELLKN